VNAFAFVTFALLGVGRNLPHQGLYFFGLGAADLLLLAFVASTCLRGPGRRALWQAALDLRVPIAATAGLGMLASVSMAYNAFGHGLEVRDLFEVLKYYYQLLVMVVACQATRENGAAPAAGFAAGAIVSGVVALLNPMNPDVLGTPQIFNPNVIGNVLSVAVVLASFVMLRGRALAGGLLAVAAALIAFFTFSKGTWLMTALGLVACALALGQARAVMPTLGSRLTRWLAAGLLVGLGLVVVGNWELVSLIVEAKIAATEFEASAAEGGSFSARFGLILSAIHMFLSNPLLGVGISNFERANHQLEQELGDAFYDDDNPNNVWFYVLGCMGLPAFVLFALVFVWFVLRLRNSPLERPSARKLFVLCVASVFFVGGNVQLEMLTAYYYWVALGAVAAWQSARPAMLPSRPAPSAAPAT
jgi:O-antigen ligase